MSRPEVTSPSPKAPMWHAFLGFFGRVRVGFPRFSPVGNVSPKILSLGVYTKLRG